MLGYYNGKNFRHLIIYDKKITIAIDAMGGENSLKTIKAIDHFCIKIKIIKIFN